MKNIIYNIVKYIVFTLCIMILANNLPILYGMLFDKRGESYSCFYSPSLKDFCITKSNNGKIERYDTKGKKYTQQDYDKVFPLFNYRQLLKDGNKIDSLNGEKINYYNISKYKVFNSYRPINKKKRTIDLYPLFESEPARIGLTMPTDIFRIKQSIEFIDVETNTINEKKSEEYNNILIKKGFSFPAKKIYGLPSVWKAYDEGYFIEDNENKVFHIKMIKHKAVINKTNISNKCKISHMQCVCFDAREIYSFVFSRDNKLYALTKDNYRLKEIDVEHFDSEKDEFMIIGSIFYWTVKVKRGEQITYYALDRKTLKLVDKVEKEKIETNKINYLEYLFPFTLIYKTQESSQIYPRIKDISYKSIIINIILLILLFIICKRTLCKKESFVFILLIITCGIYAFIPILFLKKIIEI